jgi:signal transduction histidine kinase/ligand-binding sensor domain-containing protein/DNA-binding response OmpR family regulator
LNFLLFAVAAQCQHYYFRHYKVEDGLSHNSVLCSMQDKKGFLWFGTKDGLSRYDGYSFKIFRNDAADSTTIGNNLVMSLHETKNGEIWAGCYKGLYRYDALKESFSLLKGTENFEIRSIQSDNKGNLWFVAGASLYCYYEEQKRLRNFTSVEARNSTSIILSSDSTIWISTNDGYIAKYREAEDRFTRYYLFEHSPAAFSRWIEKIYPTGKGQLLIGTSNQGLKIFDIPTGTYKDVLTYNDDRTTIFVRDFISYSDSIYWIGTESGIFMFNIKTGRIDNLRKNYGDPYSISDNAIYTFCKDREGGIWTGTYFGGVNYFPQINNAFSKFYPQNDNSSISGNAVREICADRFGNIWVGTEDAGLNKFNPATGRFTHFKPTGKHESISYSNIHGLLPVDDELLIGTFEHGLDVMNIRSGKVVRHYIAGPGKDDLKNNFIHNMIRTRNGKILIATARGFYEYIKETGAFRLFTEVPESIFYTIVKEDNNGMILLGTYRDGLYTLDPKTGRSQNFRYEPGDKNSLSSNRVNNIYQTSKNDIWLATENGLCLLNKDKRTFTRFNTGTGLPSNVIYGVLEDDAHKLWISTSKGMVHMDPANGHMKLFTRANGLLSDQFNYNSSYRDTAGNLYFGTVNGLIRFNPKEIVQSPYIPPVYITGFQLKNQEMIAGKKGSPLKQSISYTDKLTLNHDQSTFSIDFAAPGFTSPQSTEYAYKMEGLDKDWTYLKTNRKVYFTELSPGTYIFKVKATNNTGEWSNTPTEMTIRILPPFWASAPAFILYIIIGILAIFVVIKNYHRRTEEKNERKIEFLEHQKQKEIYQAKIEFFTNIAHEIRTPLTLIQLPLEKTLAQSSHLPEIHDNLLLMEKNTTRLIDLTNQLLDFRKTESNSFTLNFVKTNISELLEDIHTRFRPAAEQRKLNMKLQVPAIPLFAFVDTDAFNKIVSNLFNNAIKYAHSIVQVRLMPFNSEDQLFSIEIRNDGFIIDHALRDKIFEPFYRIKETEKEPGTGIGLPLARSLAELHNGTLELKQSDHGLNTFSLSLPIHQEKEFDLFEKKETAQAGVQVFNETDEESAGPVILLVDDNREITGFIANELGMKYTVIPAYNGEEALAVLKEKVIHLVISDIMMPVMDGLELCRVMKTNMEYSHIPVILLTAKNTLQAKVEGLEIGADVYIEKPFSLKHLQAQISSLLANRARIREYFASSPLAHIKTMAYSKADEKFLHILNETIYQHLDDTELDIDKLAALMNVSRPTLFRKIKAISDLTPHELINIARLKKAAELLARNEYKVYEVADMVGYQHQSNFARDFLKQFGVTPTEFMNEKKEVKKNIINS